MTKAKQTSSIIEVLPPRKIHYYMDHPIEFVEDMIFNKKAKIYGGSYEISAQQKEILDAVANNRRVSVRAGRGIGKSATLSWLILWWQSIFPRARVACFAPSFPQLKSVLWPEVAKWMKDSLVAPYFYHGEKRMYLIEDPKVNFSEPRSAAKEEAAQGLHEDHLLILMDEASGIDDVIYERLQGSITKKNNKVVLMTNPTRTSGFAYDSHHRNKRFWATFVHSSEDSPNVDPEYIQQMREKYVTPTFTHDMYKVHVLGEFPSGDPDAFIPLEEVDKAKYRSDASKEGPVEIGVDVARKGNDMTVVCVRQGWYVYSGEELGLYTKDETSDKESMITMGHTTKMPEIEQFVYKVVDIVRDKLQYDDVIRVKVDDTGVGGGLTDYLELDEDHNLEIVPVVFSTKSDGTYADVPSKLWGNIKENIGKIRIPNDRQLVEELSTRRWDQERGSLIKIEPKKTFKKDFGDSPDRADALCLAFADLEHEHKFIKSYDRRDTELHGYPSRVLMAGRRFCCVYSSPQQKTSAVWVTWYNGDIRVVDEFTGDTSEIIEIIRQRGENHKIIGNKDIFDSTKSDIASFFMDRGIYIMDSFGYNEMAAINNLATIAKDKHLTIATECEQIQNQLRTWTADKTSKSLHETHGLCYALTLVVNELIQTNEIINLPTIGTFSYGFNNGGHDFSTDDVNAGFMCC